MAQAIPLVLTVAGAALGVGGSLISANAEAKELRAQAGQLDAQAKDDRASSQRRSMEERRQARIAGSRALAVAAASGGGASDPSVINRIAELEGEGEYRALSALYEGETEARTKEAQAAANRRGAKTAKTVGALKAIGSMIGSGSSLFDRFAGSGPPATEWNATHQFAPATDWGAYVEPFRKKKGNAAPAYGLTPGIT